MPATSDKQRRFMGMALAIKRGETKKGSKAVKGAASSMSEKQLKDFATKQHSTPMRYHKERGDQ